MSVADSCLGLPSQDGDVKAEKAFACRMFSVELAGRGSSAKGKEGGSVTGEQG